MVASLRTGPRVAELMPYQVGGAQLGHDRGAAGGKALMEDPPHHVVPLGALPAGALFRAPSLSLQ